jgi:hypothetical protein
MSVSSPPRSGSVDKTRAKKRDRPPALELNTPDTRLNLEQDFELIGQVRVRVITDTLSGTEVMDASFSPLIATRRSLSRPAS